LCFIDLSCSTEGGKDWCTQSEGTCTVERDGYYIVGTLCVSLGLLLLLVYIKPITKRLERLPKQMWRLNSDSK
jgi:hypothetical protein